MRKPHKHAELIKAWADGVKIEKLNKDGTWSDHQDDWPWFNDWIYRIKPDKKPDFVYYGCFDQPSIRYQLDCCFTSQEDDGDQVKITFDGSTGKLKSVEIINA